MTIQQAFLAGGGAASRAITAGDWSAHPLGPPDNWSPALRAPLSLVLHSPANMLLAWGPGLHLFHNDAFSQTVGMPLPWVMGEALATVWAHGWDQTRTLLDQALAGQPTKVTPMGWIPARPDTATPVWTIQCSRVLDEMGSAAGLFMVATVSAQQRRASARDDDKWQRLARMFDQAPSFIAILRGPEHRFELVNPAYRELIGHRDPVGKTVAEVLPDAVAQGYLGLLDRAYQTGTPFAARGARFDAQPGPNDPVSERYLDFVYQPFTGDDGTVEGIFVEGSDVSDAHLASRALKENEARYRQLFNSMDEGFCIIEFLDSAHGPLSDYIHVEANAAYAVHAGIENVVGQKVRDMVPDEADGWVALYGQVLETGEPIRFERELVATGRHLELAAFRIEPPERRQVAVLFQDITARKAAEASLQRLNETLEARFNEALNERRILAEIVEGTDALVHVLGPDFRWIAINCSAVTDFERTFGVAPKVGDCLLDLLADRPESRETARVLWTRALGGETFVEVVAITDPGEERRHLEMRFSPLRDSQHRMIGAYQFVYDVTARLREQERLQQTEEALRQSQKMEAVGQLTGGLAHDFNNLLAGVSGALEMMNTRLNQGRIEDVYQYLVAAQGATRRAASLTHRLLAFSRRQTLDPRPTNVNGLVAGMEELIGRTVGPEIDIEIVGASGLWTTLVDPPQLENALLNLCINARDAMPHGGRITIETANKWLDHYAARQHDVPEGQYLALCVTDTGTGMGPDVIAKAFDPFFTTKPLGSGTGLGLSMVYGFAKQSGGHVRIYSEVGNGTTVCIYLPRHYGQAEAEDSGLMVKHPAASIAGEAVLVVDDEPTVRLLITDVMKDHGYTVIEAADSMAALKVLRSDVRLDLLITDVGLPGGMNGRQLADAARETRHGLNVLLITGYAENAILGDRQLAPGMQVLTKPFAVAALVERVRKMISG